MSYSPQVFDTDETCLFGVEESKDSVDVFPGVVFKETRSHEMDKFFERDAALSFAAEVECDLVDGRASGFRAEGADGVLDFCVAKDVPLGLMMPICSRSNMSKYSLISRMSFSPRPDRS